MKIKQIIIGCRKRNAETMQKLIDDDDIFKTSLLALCSDKFVKNIEIGIFVYKDNEKK